MVNKKSGAHKAGPQFPLVHPRSSYEAEITRAFGGHIGPPAAYDRPAVTTLALCFTNRCGSNFLAEVLASTGKVPRAGEFFNTGSIEAMRLSSRSRSFAEASAELARARAKHGLFATKIGRSQLFFLAKSTVIPRVLGMPRFIYMWRRDLLDQAISFSIASQTKAWTSEMQAQMAPRYDSKQLTKLVRGFADANAQYRMFFSMFGLSPCEVVYEDFAADISGTVSRILNWLKLDAAPPDVNSLVLRPQRSKLNAEWRDRFLDEQHGYFLAACPAESADRQRPPAQARITD